MSRVVDGITRVWLDFETFSEAPIARTGTSKYAEDPSTEPICLGYAIDDAPVRVWIPTQYLRLFEGFELFSKCDLVVSDDMPLDLRHALGTAEVWAHNAEFDMEIWSRFFGDNVPLPLKRWRDSMAMCSFFALPLSLDMATMARGQKHLKDPRGKYLIHKLSKPRKVTKKNPSGRWMPEDCADDYDDFFKYCAADVEAMRELVMGLPQTRLPAFEQSIWELTVKGNLRGLPVNPEEVASLVGLIKEYEGGCLEEIKKLTDGEIVKIGAGKKIIAWCLERGVKLPNMKAKTIDDLLKKGGLPKPVKRLFEIRRQVGRISTKKFSAILDRVCQDRTVKNNLVFWGAGPGRFAGRGFQIQNVPRLSTIAKGDIKIKADPDGNAARFDAAYDVAWDSTKLGIPAIEMVYDDFMTYASGMVRSAIQAPKGYEFISGDYSSIENRLILWCAGEAGALEKFRQGMDQYKDFAYRHHGIPYDKVNDQQRFDAKAIVLGCGFGMGWEKFKKTCDDKGNPITDKEARDGVSAFRAIYPKVPKFWYACAKAAKQAIAQPGPVVYYKSQFMKLAFQKRGKWLTMELPSGRKIRYYKPVLKLRQAPWLNHEGKHPMVETIMHMGYNKARQWVEIPLIPGRIAENAVQGIGYDIMAEGMLRAEGQAYLVHTTIHDETLSMVPVGYGSVDDFCKVICPELPWLRDFPLVAEGWRGPRYRK